SLRAESRRTAGPHIFAAAEGQELELTARSAVAVPKAGFPAQAPPVPALVSRSALLAQATSSRIAGLAELLSADDVNILTSSVADAPAVVAQEKPTLVLLEDTGDDSVVTACSGIRRLPGLEPETPIVLVTPNERRANGVGIASRMFSSN